MFFNNLENICFLINCVWRAASPSLSLSVLSSVNTKYYQNKEISFNCDCATLGWVARSFLQLFSGRTSGEIVWNNLLHSTDCANNEGEQRIASLDLAGPGWTGLDNRFGNLNGSLSPASWRIDFPHKPRENIRENAKSQTSTQYRGEYLLFTHLGNLVFIIPAQFTLFTSPSKNTFRISYFYFYS